MDMFLKAKRVQGGQALTEGVVGVMIISMTLIGALVLLVNGGLCVFYKEKLAFVTIECARFASQQSAGNDVAGKTTEFANHMLAGVGLPPGRVQVEEVDLGGSRGVKVSINETVGLLKGIPYLPGNITFEDTATAPRAAAENGCLVFRIVQRNVTGQIFGQGGYRLVYVPISGPPGHGPYYFGGSLTPNTGTQFGEMDFLHRNDPSDRAFLQAIKGESAGGFNAEYTRIPPPRDIPN